MGGWAMMLGIPFPSFLPSFRQSYFLNLKPKTETIMELYNWVGGWLVCQVPGRLWAFGDSRTSNLNIRYGHHQSMNEWMDDK